MGARRMNRAPIGTRQRARYEAELQKNFNELEAVSRAGLGDVLANRSHGRITRSLQLTGAWDPHNCTFPPPIPRSLCLYHDVVLSIICRFCIDASSQNPENSVHLTPSPFFTSLVGPSLKGPV